MLEFDLAATLLTIYSSLIPKFSFMQYFYFLPFKVHTTFTSTEEVRK